VRALRVLAPLGERIRIHAGAGAMGRTPHARPASRSSAPAARFPRRPRPRTPWPSRARWRRCRSTCCCSPAATAPRATSAAPSAHVPALGIPAGVKMHSGVYAVSPEAAGEIVAQLVAGTLVRVAPGEVRDLDEEAFRAGRLSARHFGELLVPEESRYVQHVKQGGAIVDESAVADIAAEVTESIEPGRLYILGPGTTTFAISRRSGSRARCSASTWCGTESASRAMPPRKSCSHCSPRTPAQPPSWSPRSAARGTCSAAATSRSVRA